MLKVSRPNVVGMSKVLKALQEAGVEITPEISAGLTAVQDGSHKSVRLYVGIPQKERTAGF